uniref:Uncharacterized protein n=1 Tax=Meloidogyne enterolobii TaxID=390850 RepID=A0A6V7W8T2_MELEN|nr:unnamed protein product [Meloidogyne enterolobii]
MESLFLLLFIISILIEFPIVRTSFQSRRPSLYLPSKQCDKPCFNGGTCSDGACHCPSGWNGPQCENCHGRILKKLSLHHRNGSISDGPNSYSASAGCIWVFENSDKNQNGSTSSLLFKLDDFFTECCWDMLYIYDGDGVYGDLLGVFSGNLQGREVLAKSGQAIVYFASDLAFNLPGFNISYYLNDESEKENNNCLLNCSGNGRCNENGICICNEGFSGEACEHQRCLSNMDGQIGPCKNKAFCKRNKCECTKHTHGDRCQELLLNPTWDIVVPTTTNISTTIFSPRASHKSVLIGDDLWIYGGLTLNPTDYSLADFVVYNVKKRSFHSIPQKDENGNKKPLQRYDHSIVHYQNKLYIFGGVINQRTVTNEFWEYNPKNGKWTDLSSHDDSVQAFPLPVAGHTAHVVGTEMHVLFGYNPYEGYLYIPQIYSFETKKWRRGEIDSAILGRFGHSSVLFTDPNIGEMILVYGGYNAPLSSYTYAITDELILYNPTKQIWTHLGNYGVPLFRHSAVLMDDGVMLLVGGNSHNESSTTRKNDCFSGQVHAFDTVCKRWLKIYTNEFTQISRYGHDAFLYNSNMFVIGGFNGEMHNDVIKFTPANCDSQARDEEDCERLANGVRCIFFNKTCSKTLPTTSLRHSFLQSILKGDSMLNSVNDAVQQQKYCPTHMDKDSSTLDLRQQCSQIIDCSSCLSEKGCGWCESSQSCLGSFTNCVDGGLLTDHALCPQSIKQRRKEITKQLRPCNLATNCFACYRLNHCIWFAIDGKQICVSLADQALLLEEQTRIQMEKATTSNTQQQQQPSTSITTISQPSLLSSQSLSRTATQDVIVMPQQLKHSTSALIEGQNQRNGTCSVPCFLKNSCQSCIEAQCMWCPSNHRCVSMDTYMISFPYGQCQSWMTAANTNYACQNNPFACKQQKTCSDCQSIGPRCGWCDDGSGTGLGTCIEGSASGPRSGEGCPSERWFFTGEPDCQCNGHSTCTENSTHKRFRCTRCKDKTRGEHCEQCESGYYGDPRNGGECKECQCNGQATLCNPTNGDCFCSTKGVLGPRCDKCEPKYIGDPKNGGTCTYELAIDFIFTFKLDSDDIRDKYVNQINFFSVPFKRDTDVQFTVTCEGDSGAKVTINLTSQPLEGGNQPFHVKYLMAGQLCTSTGIKRTYSSSDPNFSYGTDANTTFNVRISDFVTPIKIQISFAQSLPINWILFFVIFAACFIVLLVVAGLIWIIKMRIEWYRNIRRRHDEIEEMASRPFASIQLDLGGDSMKSHVDPCAVEPCSNYQAGVYTVIVKLPTGGQTYTPFGTSGLAVASALCQLTSAQLALLQPPNTEKRPKRKSNLKRFMPFMS